MSGLRRLLFTRSVVRLAWDVAADPLAYSTLACEGAAMVLSDMGHQTAAARLLGTLGAARIVARTDSGTVPVVAECPPEQLSLFPDTATRPDASTALSVQRRT